jgi:hypothetical protein
LKQVSLRVANIMLTTVERCRGRVRLLLPWRRVFKNSRIQEMKKVQNSYPLSRSRKGARRGTHSGGWMILHPTLGRFSRGLGTRNTPPKRNLTAYSLTQRISVYCNANLAGEDGQTNTRQSKAATDKEV